MLQVGVEVLLGGLLDDVVGQRGGGPTHDGGKDRHHEDGEDRRGSDPVPHRHYVFTIPKALRGLFERERRLLGLLSRCAYAAIKKSFRAVLDRQDVLPGCVASLQTFGSYAANFHPHVHALCRTDITMRSYGTRSKGTRPVAAGGIARGRSPGRCARAGSSLRSLRCC